MHTITTLRVLRNHILSTRPHINMWTWRVDENNNGIDVHNRTMDVGIGGCIIGIAAFSGIASIQHNGRCWDHNGRFDWESYIAHTFPELVTHANIREEFFGFDDWIISVDDAIKRIDGAIHHLSRL